MGIIFKVPKSVTNTLTEPIAVAFSALPPTSLYNVATRADEVNKYSEKRRITDGTDIIIEGSPPLVNTDCTASRTYASDNARAVP